MSHTAPTASRTSVRSRRREQTALVLLVVSALALPALVLWAKHVDGRWAAQPAETLVVTGLVAPALLVPAGLVLVWLSRRWSRSEKLVATSLALGWTIPYVVATSSFGCDDSGGALEPCSATPTSTPRELGIVLISLAVVTAGVWLDRRAGDRS